ncbi:MAG: gamma-glutamylcyclotransferase [Chloroflexi bacterium]|nr:gamma-glutamylcyclotransferase [Chloroflexota bacterium]
MLKKKAEDGVIKEVYYFAYASNLNRKQMTERAPDSKPKFIATLPNFKLTFTARPGQQGGVASITPHRGEKVLGAVYEISERDLKRLDGYEGYPTVYDRRKVTVWTETNEPTGAITYIKIDQSREALPSSEYLAVIQQGYRDWQIV